MRADEFLDQGNLDGKRLWMRIMLTIEALRRERPGTGRRCIERTAGIGERLLWEGGFATGRNLR